MYSTLAADAPASDQIWWAFTALRLLDDAADALAGAEAVCRGLAEDSAWGNEGASARTLREALGGLHASVMTELAAVHDAHAQVQNGLGT